jgi:hypothetical protein
MVALPGIDGLDGIVIPPVTAVVDGEDNENLEFAEKAAIYPPPSDLQQKRWKRSGRLDPTRRL